jgi:hypothetical protein
MYLVLGLSYLGEENRTQIIRGTKTACIPYENNFFPLSINKRIP